MWERIQSVIERAAKRAGLTGVPMPALVAACAVCAAIVAWAAWRWWPAEESAALVVEPKTAPATVVSRPETAPVEQPGVVVHVAGAVRRPGVYRLADGARVVDAVEMAGGTLPDAVTAALNLARRVTDGEQVLVPTEDDLGNPVAGQAPPQGAAGGASPAAAAMIDINTADAAALDTLPGVGPSTAAKIIAERESGGPFASVDDLGRVSGIGPKRLEALKDYVCVR